MANKLIDTIFTASSMSARIAFALIHVTQTPSIVVSSRTFASEPVYQVNTNATISTRVRRAFVYVIFTMSTSVALSTFTRVAAKTHHRYIFRSMVARATKKK